MSAVETHVQVHQHLADLSRSLHSQAFTVQAAAQRIVDWAVNEIPGAQHAGITLTMSDQADVAAASDPIHGRLAAIQLRHREGPCRGAATDLRTKRIDDLSAGPLS